MPSNNNVITANLAWGEAREALGHARALAEVQPSDETRKDVAKALATARKAWADWNSALVAADIAPIPYGADLWGGG